MLLVAIAWIYVVLMIAVVEATSSNGSVFGAIVTVVLYGVLPVGILGYLFFSPARKRARRAAEADSAETISVEPDSGDHSPGDSIASVRKEP